MIATLALSRIHSDLADRCQGKPPLINDMARTP
jgi:hypothetical protein